MKPKYLLIPVIFEILGFVSIGISGGILMGVTYPVFLCIDLLFGSNYKQFQPVSGSDGVWPMMIWIGIIAPLLFFPIYAFLKKKYTGTQLRNRSFGIWYISLVILTGIFLF